MTELNLDMNLELDSDLMDSLEGKKNTTTGEEYKAKAEARKNPFKTMEEVWRGIKLLKENKLSHLFTPPCFEIMGVSVSIFPMESGLYFVSVAGCNAISPHVELNDEGLAALKAYVRTALA